MENENKVSFKKVFTIVLYAYLSVAVLGAISFGCYLIATY